MFSVHRVFKKSPSKLNLLVNYEQKRLLADYVIVKLLIWLASTTEAFIFQKRGENEASLTELNHSNV